MKAGSICDHSSSFVLKEMDHAFSASEGHKVEVSFIFYHADEVAGKTTKVEKLYGQGSIPKVYDICKLPLGKVR